RRFPHSCIRMTSPSLRLSPPTRCCFFFSSRRRHTRSLRDWSSDVCSSDLRIRDEERRGREVEHAEVVRRLSTVLAGGSSKGRAGENVLREHLAELPPAMLVSDFRVNGKVVEYGLLLPDGRRLPIDSKWSAMRELEALERATDPAQRDLLAREVERVVAGRAREVAAYLDPA